VWKLIVPLVSVHQLVLFFPDVYKTEKATRWADGPGGDVSIQKDYGPVFGSGHPRIKSKSVSNFYFTRTGRSVPDVGQLRST